MSCDPHDRRSEASTPRGVLSGITRRTPDGLEQRLLARARAAGLVVGDRLIVGFSGGRDSLALAAAVRRAAVTIGLDLLLVHVDHRLRPCSGEDAVRAAALAEQLDLPLRVVALPEAPPTRHPGVGVEEAARRERYRVLVEEAEAAGAVAIVTAHHQDDQAETVLLHLLRGGGVHGAAGMAERSPVPRHASEPSTPQHDISLELSRPWLWRPFLQEPRAVIEKYVGQLGLEPIEDPSNAFPDFRRNLLRGTILPQIESAFPGASAALARYARLAADDDRALDAMAEDAMQGVRGGGGTLRADVLRGHGVAVQRRMVRRWFLARTGLSTVSADRTDALLDLAERGEGGRTIELGGGWSATCRGGMLRLDRAEREARRGA